MSISKKGIWKNTLMEPPLDNTLGISYNEEKGDYLNSTWSHTPTNGDNSSFAFAKIHHDDNPGEIYHLSLTVKWDGFLTDMQENFNIYWQGYYYNTSQSKWVWGNSPELAAMNNIKQLNTLVKSANSGTYQYEVDFTTSSTISIANLRYRSNYSNGIGTLYFSNLRVIPLEDYLAEKEVKEFLNKTIANNFIEI